MKKYANLDVQNFCESGEVKNLLDYRFVSLQLQNLKHKPREIILIFKRQILLTFEEKL